MSSSEEERSPVKGPVIKVHMKDKEKQEKTKMVLEVADGKVGKKDKTSKGKSAKDWKEDKVSMTFRRKN